MSIEQLSHIIEEAIQEKTFSLEAVGTINKLRQSAKELKAELEQKDELIKTLRIKTVEIEKLASISQTALDQANKELAELRAQKDQLLTWRLTAEFEGKRREDVFRLVETVFKSPVVKQTISESGSVPVSCPTGGYLSTSNTYSTRTVETKEE